jgi:hypothetical protein
MLAHRLMPQTDGPRQGRHAIRRERPLAEVCRLRHAQVTFPRGLHRTRVSEMRTPWVRRASAWCHPFRPLERTAAVSLPVLMG